MSLDCLTLEISFINELKVKQKINTQIINNLQILQFISKYRGKNMAVFGYSSATSVLAGNSVSFHLSTDTPGLTNLTIERIGNTSISAIISTTLSSLSPPQH